MKESKIHGPRMSDIPRYSLKQYLALMIIFYGSFVFLTYPVHTGALLILVAVALLTFKFNRSIKPPVLFTPKAEKQ